MEQTQFLHVLDVDTDLPPRSQLLYKTKASHGSLPLRFQTKSTNDSIETPGAVVCRGTSAWRGKRTGHSELARTAR